MIKKRRVFDDEKIASLDAETASRANLVARLLGGSKEARHIQQKFRKMVEVPQEEFSLNNYKELTGELMRKVRKPDPVYAM